MATWRARSALPPISHFDGGEWVYNDKATMNQDMVTYMAVDDALSGRQGQVIVLARLGDTSAEVTGSDYTPLQ